MTKVTVLSVYEKQGKMVCKIIDNGDVIDEVPYLTSLGFLKKPIKSKSHYGYLIKDEGRNYVVAAEDDLAPSLNEDEVTLFRNASCFLKLTKEGNYILEVPHGKVEISASKLLLKHGETGVFEMSGGKIGMKSAGGDLHDIFNGIFTNIKSLQTVSPGGAGTIAPQNVALIEAEEVKMDLIIKKVV